MSNAIIQKLKELGYTTIKEDYYNRVQMWKSWYVGKVKGFHRYRSYNGNRWVNRDRASLCMAKKVCEDWANLLMNDKVSITLEGEKEQEFVDRVFADNNFWVRCNEMQELKFAMGTVAYIPRVIGQTAGGIADRVALDYVTVENIYPLSWQNGIITECAFATPLTRHGQDYMYLQVHRKGQNSTYCIENHIYRHGSESLVEEPLTNVEGFETIPASVQTGSAERQFVIDRPNIANNLDYTLPLGIPIYANAIDVLRGVDCAFDCYINEFENGPMMLMVKMPATKWEDGAPTLDDNDRRFYLLPEDTQQGNVIEPVSPVLRTQQLNIGLQDQLNILSSKCGFGEEHYKFDRGGVATATQVVSENSALYHAKTKHEVILKQALTELCRILIRLGNSALGAGLDENVEISIDFDNSIIEDKEAEFNREERMLNDGIMNDYEARMRWFNEDEATAKAALPKMQDMTNEEEQEIE